MGDVLTFTPRPKPVAPAVLEPLSGAALRTSLEEAAQTALDAADRIIAVLDRLDGGTDHDDGGDAELSLAAPEGMLPELAAETTVIQDPPLRWAGNGNILAAAGSVLIDLLERA